MLVVPLRNRVDPFGHIHAVAERGLFTGNRGVIHDASDKTLTSRRWTTKAWIVCTLEHPGGVRRDPMGRNTPGGRAGWTELFFLDEVTALAAGHRPCLYCRREAAKDFQRRFADGNNLQHASAPRMDALLHGQRMVSGDAGARTLVGDPTSLPDGAMIAAGGVAYAVKDGLALPWSFGGYGTVGASIVGQPITLITPPSTLAALREGYRPVWHPSVES
ncbi:hypothetical protein [Mesorhizobium sp. CAU 1732]|uniref:hypothetical protein n=1 Tax=Mesorhizobium sp. CAU 1732 TaxID=3140358 RepID=UPI00326105A3